MTERERLRERLVELLKIPYEVCKNTFCPICKHKGEYYCYLKKYSDSLLDNGVIVPQIKVGDSVYVPLNNDSIITANVNSITIYDKKLLPNAIVYNALTEHVLAKLNFYETEIGKTVFLTYEEAEAALKERERYG